MFCKQCGQEVPSGAQYCSACGARVAGRAPHPARGRGSLLWWTLGGILLGVAVGLVLITQTRPKPIPPPAKPVVMQPAPGPSGQGTPSVATTPPPPTAAAPAVTVQSLEADLRKRNSGKERDGYNYLVSYVKVHALQGHYYGVVICGPENSEAYTMFQRYRPATRDWDNAVCHLVDTDEATFEQVDIPYTAQAWGVPAARITDWIRTAEVAAFDFSYTAPLHPAPPPAVTLGAAGESATALAKRAYPGATVEDDQHTNVADSASYHTVTVTYQGTRLVLHMEWTRTNPHTRSTAQEIRYRIWQVADFTR